MSNVCESCPYCPSSAPKSGRKDVADKMIIADLMAFALDVPPPARIVLISGDRDFAYPLSLIRGRGYQIVLFTPPVGAVPILEASANYVARWRQDVLGMERDGFGRLYASSTPSKPLPRSSSPSRHGRATPSKSSSSSSTNAASSSAMAPTTSTPSRPTTPTPQPTPSQPASQAQTAALSGPGAGPVPGVFAPLVQALEEFKKEGQPRPLRSRVALRLTAIDKDVYEKAGASSFRDYVAVAIAAGIVMLGSNGSAGTEWISLRSLDPASFAAPATPGKPSATSAAPSTPIPSSASQSKAVVIESLQDEATESPDNYAPSPAFEPLLHAILAAESASQRSPPYASAVGQQLDSMIRSTPSGQSDPFAMAGTRTFGGYINAAFKSRVAKLVPTEKQGVAALEVMPVYQSYMAKLRRNRTASSQTSSTTAASTPAAAAAPYQPIKSTPIRPTSPIKRSSSPTFKKGSFFPSLFRTKSDTGSEQSTPNGKKSVWDVPGLVLPHQPSGTKIAAVYFPLANALLYQRERGQFYMTDESLHVIVSKHKGIGDRLKDSKVFARYLDAAQQEGVCTLEDGFKAGMRHVRLTPQLCDPKEHDPANSSAKKETLPPAGDDPWDDDYEPNHSTPLPKKSTTGGDVPVAAVSKASQEQDTAAASAASLPSSVPSTGNDAPASASKPAISVDGSSKAESTNTSSTTGAATNRPAATGKATLTPTVQDRVRFKPLMDIMLALRKETPPVVAPRRSYVNDLLAKRHGIPVNPLNDLSSSTSGAGLSLLTTTTAGKTMTLDLTAFFRDRGATALGDYTRQAEQYGFIHCERETRADGELGKRRLRLTEKYEQLLAHGSSGGSGAAAAARSGSGGSGAGGANGSTSGGSTKG